MPTLPTRDSLGYAVPQAPRVPLYEHDISGVGRGTVAIGHALTEIADTEQRKTDALDLIKAEAEHRKGLYEIERTLATDPDYSSYDQKFQQMSGALSEKSVGLVRSPYAREMFAAKAGTENEQVRNKILERGLAIKRQEQHGVLEESLTNHMQDIANPDSSEEQRARARKSMEDSVNLAVKSGLVNPLHGYKLKYKYNEAADEFLIRNRISMQDDTVLNDLSYGAKTQVPASSKFLAMTARLETGKSDPLKGIANISPDSSGTRSYGNLGLNSGGSAQQFVAAYGDQFGFTAKPGTSAFDAQWRKVAAENPKELHAAELDWYNKNILPRIQTDLQQAGVPEEVSTDPRVQAYFADRLVQYGPASIQNHAQRIEQAITDAGNDPINFLTNMSAADRAALKQDFPKALATGVYNVEGHNNRISGRESSALDISASGFDSGPYKHLSLQKRSQLLNVARIAFREKSEQDLKNSLKLIEDTGQAPVDEKGRTALERAKLSFTDNEYERAKLRWQESNLKYKVTSPLGDMPETDVRTLLDKIHPSTDDPQYALASRVEEHAWKAWSQMSDMRENDPAASVEGTNEVMEARTKIFNARRSSKVPVVSENEQIIAARIAAQQRLGIYRPRIISEQEAKGLLRLPKNPTEEDIDAEINKAVARAKAAYGEYAPIAVKEAINFQIRSKNERDIASTSAEILMKDKPTPQPSTSLWESIFGKSTSGEEKPGAKVKAANDKQRKWLAEDPEGRSAIFDKEFGAGSAAIVLQEEANIGGRH